MASVKESIEDFFEDIKLNLPVLVTSKMVYKLPEALQKAIAMLEDETDSFDYDWKQFGHCNCGVVVAAMTKKGTAEQANKVYRVAAREAAVGNGPGTSWENLKNLSCTATGQPVYNVFKKLSKLGLLPSDISDLEYLRNEVILKEAGMVGSTASNFFTNKANLIPYLKAWLRIINKTSERKNFTAQDVLEADRLIEVALSKTETKKRKLETV